MAIQQGGTFQPDNRIVSPGVFTRVLDQSGIAQGVADIGGVIVAPFPKGPGFAPTLFTNVNELQKQFGIPDGVYYGPYTATEYIKERGLVTVVRVGGLTGYQQKYPIGIWAVKGTWGRNGDAGALVSQSSFLFLSGSTITGYPESVTFSSSISASVTASTNMTITSASFTITFAASAATDANFSASSNSGSLFFNGTRQVLGVASLPIGNIVVTPGTTNTSLSASIVAGTFTGTFASPVSLTFPHAVAPFNTALQLVNGTISVVRGLCASPSLIIAGVLSGSFGAYNGTFTANAGTNYDVCTNTWTTGSTSDTRMLAVLADTQFGGISDLKAPGFSGSSMLTASNIVGTNQITVDFNLTLKNSNSSTPIGVYQFSLDEASSKYITNVFGNDPTAGNPAKQVTGQKIEAAYLYKVFENAIAEVVADRTEWQIVGATLPQADSPDSTTTDMTGEPLNFTDVFSRDLTNGDSGFSLTHATTPWINSQQIAPWQSGSAPTRFRLFRAHTLSDGTNTNTSYKLEVSNVKLAGTVAGSDWGSFTLGVRAFSDTDKKPVYLEQYNNLSLDPNSSNFIARRIGDRFTFIDFKGKLIEFGDFTNNSKYIRIEMNNSAWPVSAVPYGFDAFVTPFDGSAGFWTPTLKYTKASVYSLNPGKYPSGITFDDAPVGADSELIGLYPLTSTGNGASLDNRQYMAPLPVFGAFNSIGRNIGFALDSDYELNSVGTGKFFSGTNAVPAIFDSVNESTYVKMRKFILGFQGGFDGQSPATPINTGGNITPGNTQGLDCTTSTSAGSVAYNQAITALGNADQWDINLIVVPGIMHQHHPYVTGLVVDMCEKRGDVFYIMDMYSDDGNPSSGQIDEVVRFASQYDTNIAATYYPWVKILDVNINRIVTVPPSVVLPAVYASNDKVAAEWFAPAGLNRGGISIAVQVTDRTTHEERDTLYEGKVNPIASFPGSGIVVWGQKTLQNASSALDRVNVVRLIINLRKFIASTSKYLVFEQNIATTRNKFLSIVNPYLESVQQRAGLYAFFVRMDDSNNTPDIIDQNILYGQILLKPTKTAEFVVIDFNVLPTGAAFPNA
jgi:hypothetical protein